MKIYKIKRPVSLNYTSFYFFLPEKASKHIAHVVEHILIRRLLNENFEIMNFTAITTSDYIRLQIESNQIEEIFSFFLSPSFISNISSEELKISLDEINQESNLQKNFIPELLDLIRTKEITAISLVIENSLKDICSFLDNAYIVSVGDYDHPSTFLDGENRVSPLNLIETPIKKISNPIGNFTTRYLSIPIEKLPNKRSMYFIQQYITQVNEKMQNLRELGSYSSTAFVLFHRLNIEIFLISTVNPEINRNISNKINEILDEPYIDKPYKKLNQNYYMYKEDVAALYLYPACLEETQPILDIDNINLLKYIVKHFETIDLEKRG